MVGGSRRIGPRAPLGEFLGFGDLLSHFIGDRVQLVGACRTLREKAILEPRDGAALFPFLDVFARPVREIAHPFGMSSRAVSATLDQGRPLARSCPANGLAGDFIDPQNVVAVELEPRHAVAFGPVADTRVPCRILEWHFGGKLIVFADEQHRQVPDAGQVQPFVKGAVIGRPISEKSDRYLVGFEQFEAVSRPCSLQDAGPDDAACSHHSDFGAE